jgi:hypothetical protein
LKVAAVGDNVTDGIRVGHMDVDAHGRHECPDGAQLEVSIGALVKVPSSAGEAHKRRVGEPADGKAVEEAVEVRLEEDPEDVVGVDGQAEGASFAHIGLEADEAPDAVGRSEAGQDETSMAQETADGKESMRMAS